MTSTVVAGRGKLWWCLAAEWGKLWSVRSTWWCLPALVALTVLSALTLGGSQATDLLREGVRAARLPATQPVISSMTFAEFAVVTLAMLAITAEYASGSIRGTLQATPIRGRVMAAKALVAGAAMFVAGALSGLAAAGVTHLLLLSDVFGGFSTLSPGETVSDLLRVGVFCALVAMLTVGVGTAVRSAAGTLSVVFMLLLGVPLLLLMTGAQWALEVSLRLPMFAGLAFMGSSDNLTGGPIPYSPGEGLTWLIGWTALALAAGYAVLRRRDA